MKKKKFKMTRRQVLKAGLAGGAGLLLPWRFLPAKAFAAPAALGLGLSDPALQPKFVNLVPDALSPGFKFTSNNNKFKVAVGPSVQMTGLVDTTGGVVGAPVPTPVWGYGLPSIGYTWPGRTFEVESGVPIEVKWENKLLDPITGAFLPHLLPVDTSLHWAYSQPGYEQYTIANAGVPIVSHLHGGHSAFQYDGNPEFFFSPGYGVRGPQWVEKKYIYLNDQGAGNLWYHDHALGITRLNVYTGMAGFYFVRDDSDTGQPGNPLTLPAYPGDPAYEDFISGEGVTLGPPQFPDNPNNVTLPSPWVSGGGPTALAEFFGDHMVVNGLIWPKEDVEPRNYRMHLLNGTDSRFMAIRFRVAASPTSTDLIGAGPPLPFYVVGSDQGLASSATLIEPNLDGSGGFLLSEPGSRYDIVFDFSDLVGQRIIMENIGGDEPFGGDIPGPQVFGETDRIMAFDVVLNIHDATIAAGLPDQPDVFDPDNIGNSTIPNTNPVNRIRKVALFEGMDEFGRLQPLLGTAELATDYLGNPINWPVTPEYQNAGLVGQMQGSIAWHSPTTENPALGDTEIWEIYNATGDAHPVHLHLVHFDVLDRQEFTADVIDQPVVQHNGLLGDGFRLETIVLGAAVPQPAGYVENAPKDMVTALPGQVTRIQMTFDKPGRYVWHCHILSHEDHEMMRVLHVGPGA